MRSVLPLAARRRRPLGYAARMPARRPRLVTNTLVPVFARYLRARGKDPLPLLYACALPADAEARTEAQVPLDALLDFQARAEAALGEPHLGLRAAEALELGRYGLVEFIARTAATLRDSLALFVRYQGLVDDTVRFSLAEARGVAVFEFGAPGVPGSMGRHGNEYTLCILLRMSRLALGDDWSPSRLWFAHPAPPDPAPLFAFLGTRRVRFGAPNSGAELPAHTLDRELPGADPALHAFLSQQAQSALPAPGEDFLSRARRRTRALMERGLLRVELLAAQLGLSARTCQRRLADEGTSFHALADEVRRQAALALLADRELPLGEVAFRLGYAELRPFVRAFKRWTGTTPGRYRSG